MRAELSTRLRARQAEIAQAAMARVYGISDLPDPAESEYVEGLRVAVAVAVDYAVNTVEWGDERSPIPAVLLIQARLAARNGVSLDTVLRRYFAGYTLLGDFLMQEAKDGDLGGAALKLLLRAQASAFDRLVAAVTEEYTREADGRLGTSEQRRAERIEGLLAGELLDTSEFAYDFDANHLGAIAAGPGAGDAIRDLAKALDCRLLLVHRGEGQTLWAWLGARHRLDSVQLEPLVSSGWPVRVSLAVGEPAEGLPGWRLTHQQARAALSIALRSPKNLVRYVDVALLASMLQDDVLTTSLRQLYIEPLSQERDGGASARQTLRAYIATEQNVTSAAAALGVNRNTVANRLRAIEKRIGRPLAACVADLDAALRFEELAEQEDSSFSRLAVR